MHIFISATTATTVATGDPIRTGNTGTANAQFLPDWAPDIAYIPTTVIAGIDVISQANIYGPTTTIVGGVGNCLMQRAIVRNYDKRHFCLDRHIGPQLEHTGIAVEHAVKGDVVIALTYRAVGELSR